MGGDSTNTYGAAEDLSALSTPYSVSDAHAAHMHSPTSPSTPATPLTPSASAAATASVWRRPLRRSVAAVAVMAMVTGGVAMMRSGSSPTRLAPTSGLAASAASAAATTHADVSFHGADGRDAPGKVHEKGEVVSSLKGGDGQHPPSAGAGNVMPGTEGAAPVASTLSNGGESNGGAAVERGSAVAGEVGVTTTHEHTESCGKGCTEAVYDDDTTYEADKSTPSADSALTTSTSTSTSTSSCDGCPSIVMITLDDVGYNDLGYMSSDMPFVSPNLDRLAANGVKLDEYYGQSVCTPARTALMSGKFVHRTGFNTQQGHIEVFPISNYSVPLSHKLLPEYLQDVGYATHVIGKWNIGHCHQDYLPWNRGADTFLGYTCAGVTYDTHRAYGNSSYPDPTSEGTLPLYDMLDGRGENDWKPASNLRGAYTTHLFTSRAVEHVMNHMDTEPSRPLFMWLAYHAAHDDPHAHPPTSDLPQYDLLLNATEAAGLGHKRVMAALTLTDLDNSVGSLVATMNTTGMLHNSVIIVTSDNGGDPCGVHLVGDNHPLRGSKMTYFQGGLKVPGFVYSPNKAYIPHQARGSSYSGLMHHVDWVRTIYEGMLGRSLADDGYETSTLDSLNHWQAITADPSDPEAQVSVRDNIVFALTHHYVALIKRVGGSNIKVMKNLFNSTWFGDAKETNNAMECNQNMQFDEFDFMFNLTADPMERTNLWDHPEKQTVLSDILSWADERYSAEYYHAPREFGDEADRDLIYWHFFGNGSYIVPWGCATLE